MCPGPKPAAAPARLSVVSGYGNNTLTPRGQRTQRLVAALRDSWDVDLIAMPDKPSSASPGGTTVRRAALRRFAGNLAFRVLLDRWEAWSVRNLARWRPDGDAALLIASPWSPVAYASRRLAAAGIPYVVDVGDPWVLTGGPYSSALPLWRARPAERFLWEHASGGVVTTTAQAEQLQRLFPQLPILIRANGYKPVDSVPPPRRHPDRSTLRLAHFGILSASRIDPVPFLAALRRSGHWRSIVFDQFGDDFGMGLDRVPDGVVVRHHQPRPWGEVVARAGEFDAALVVAYPQPELLPSKAIEYSTLPLPRIAITNPEQGDALREFARERSGWLAVSNEEAGIGERVWEHLERDWAAADLAPPAEDAWPAVAAKVAEFVTRLTSQAVPAPEPEDLHTH